MMFAAGMVIGAVCGVCIMCVVSCKREMQYQAIMEAVDRRNQKGAQTDIE